MPFSLLMARYRHSPSSSRRVSSTSRMSKWPCDFFPPPLKEVTHIGGYHIREDRLGILSGKDGSSPWHVVGDRGVGLMAETVFVLISLEALSSRPLMSQKVRLPDLACP
ncbi:hypothetical protein AVEN_262167-1 [Araneus ventricosus]|uniref:Uncharacterized protein n=1 Tax=Araneus ventricosus TaxID=182803 RepID=A0A4Y2EHX5_ARAVE|nr:hypothetical protein AVEN_262167-1 [Araneus ventricosus]